jgi:hypothetical protein
VPSACGSSLQPLVCLMWWDGPLGPLPSRSVPPHPCFVVVRWVASRTPSMTLSIPDRMGFGPLRGPPLLSWQRPAVGWHDPGDQPCPSAPRIRGRHHARRCPRRDVDRFAARRYRAWSGTQAEARDQSCGRLDLSHRWNGERPGQQDHDHVDAEHGHRHDRLARLLSQRTRRGSRRPAALRPGRRTR